LADPSGDDVPGGGGQAVIADDGVGAVERAMVRIPTRPQVL
jgi:hypothetical protein